MKTTARLAAWAVLVFWASPAQACESCRTGGACGCGPNCRCSMPAPAAPAADLRVRQNQSALTDRQRQDFVDAVLALNRTSRPGSSLTIYEEYVQLHGASFDIGQAHGASAFLPWHRELLLRFENDLRTINPSVTIPYWDFTVDPFPAFLGGNGDPDRDDAVVDGPFRQGEWVLTVRGPFEEPYLRREFGRFAPTLPTPADVEAALNVDQYDAFSWDLGSPLEESFRIFLEGFNHPSGEAELHNRVHAWIGGSMALRFAPNDPVFWLLHSNIDRVWAEWQARYGLTYLPVEGGPEGHNLHDLMTPFGVTPGDVLDHRALGYRYDTEGVPGAKPVPAPPGWVLAGLGAAGLLAAARRRRAGPGRPNERPVPGAA